MSQVKIILQAVADLGVITYDDLEAKTKIPRNKLRWSCNAMKSDGTIKQTEEPITKEVAWTLTPKGRNHLDKITASDKPAKIAVAKAPEKANEETIEQAKDRILGKKNAEIPVDRGSKTHEQHAVDLAVKNYNKTLDLQDKITQLETDLARLTNVEADLAEWKRIAATASCGTPEELRTHLAFQDTELVEATRRANEAQEKLADLEAEAASKIATAQEELSDKLLTKLEERDPAGYLVATPNKPLRRFSKAHSADQIAAAAAKRSGIAEVFVIYPHKKAVRGVEWKAQA